MSQHPPFPSTYVKLLMASYEGPDSVACVSFYSSFDIPFSKLSHSL